MTINDITCFHYEFERIHPFQDGNGRVGRLIALKECLRYGIVPFIIEDSRKTFYDRGLSEWEREKGYLTDTCLDGQDTFQKLIDMFNMQRRSSFSISISDRFRPTWTQTAIYRSR